MEEPGIADFPLHTAAFAGRDGGVVKLLDEVDANEPATCEATPLHCASVCAAPAEVIKTLLQHGAHPNPLTSNGATPLHTAAACGNDLAIAALHEHAEGLDPDAVLPTSLFTPLHLAVASANVASVQRLLALGANIDAEATKGISALHIAAFVGEPTMVKALLDAGAQLAAMSDGTTCLHLVCSSARSELLAGTIAALSAVDWVGGSGANALRVQGCLMRALAHSVAPDKLDETSTQVLAQSHVLSNAAAIQQLHRSQIDQMRQEASQPGSPTAHTSNGVSHNASDNSAAAPRPERAQAERSGCFASLLQALGCGPSATKSNAEPQGHPVATRAQSKSRRDALDEHALPARAKSALQAVRALPPDMRRSCTELLLRSGCRADARCAAPPTLPATELACCAKQC
jgi:Ankyrin repeats (3 copies)